MLFKESFISKIYKYEGKGIFLTEENDYISYIVYKYEYVWGKNPFEKCFTLNEYFQLIFEDLPRNTVQKAYIR